MTGTPVCKTKRLPRAGEKKKAADPSNLRTKVKSLPRAVQDFREQIGSREDVQRAAKKEATRFLRCLFELRCDESPLESYMAVGQVIERSFIKERAEVEAYTKCPSCGCATVFRTDLFYANG